MKQGLNAKIIIIACTVIIIGTVAAILIINQMSDRETANPTSEVQTTDLQHVEELSYEDAVIAYQEAIRLNPEDMTNYTKLAKLHLENGNEEEAVEVAYEGIGVGKKIKEETGEVLTGFPELAKFLVDAFKDFNRMDDLKKLLDELERILDDVIFAEEADRYFPDVTASLEAGTYEEAQTLSLESSGKAIFYTLDGSEPTKESEVYAEPISLDGGEYIVKAMAQGTAEQETFGDVLTAEYTIEISVPELTEKEMARVQELYDIVSTMDVESVENLQKKKIDTEISAKLQGFAYDGENIVDASNVEGMAMNCGQGVLWLYYGDIGDYVAEGYGISYFIHENGKGGTICNWVNGIGEGNFKDFHCYDTTSSWWSGTLKGGKYEGKVVLEISNDSNKSQWNVFYKNGCITKKGFEQDEEGEWNMKSVSGYDCYLAYGEGRSEVAPCNWMARHDSVRQIEE